MSDIDTKVHEHETKIAVLETHFVQIKDDMSYIRETMDTFVEDINGIPKQNEKAIEEMKEDSIKPLAAKVSRLNDVVVYGSGAVGLLMLILYLVYG